MPFVKLIDVNMPRSKSVSIDIETTQEALEHRNISMADLRRSVEYLAGIFGTKYPSLFPKRIRSEHLDRFLQITRQLQGIEEFAGFKRHIKEYNKNNIDDHLFTARTAEWLNGLGYNVELEPFDSACNTKRPDIRCSDSDGSQFFLECKRIRKEKFYDQSEKRRLADLVYEKVPTCDQLTIYLENEASAQSLEEKLDDPAFVLEIHKAGIAYADSSVNVDGKFKINVMRKPAIVGAENAFPIVLFEMILEDVGDGERLPGYAFLQGGRSVGVFGPPPDYSSIWSRKRSKSKKQHVPDYPFVVVVWGEDVLGLPEAHEGFFKRVWLTDENSECSGIGILSTVTADGRPKFQYFENPKARHKLPTKCFDF